MADKGDDCPTNHPLSGLIQTATLTNRELFTAVIAAIKRDGSAKERKRKKSDKKKDVSWQRVAVKVATSAAKGEDGYASTNDWVSRFNELLLIDGDGDSENGHCSRSADDEHDAATTKPPTNFGEAIKALSVRDCHHKRLRNALDALSSSMTMASSMNPNLSIHQVAGLIRGSSFLGSNEVDDVDVTERSSNDDDIALQARAIAHLVQSISTLASSPSSSTNPCDIFLAIQLPLLQKLHWDAYINGGLTFTSDDARAEFQNLLSLKFDKESQSSGEKRRRESEVEDCDAKKNDVLQYSASTSVHRLVLEAAHLARNGAVRAQHGAIIYIPTSSEKGCNGDGDGKVKIIGWGWNHDYLLDPSTSNKNKLVLHSEVHAVADAISRYGEDECFESLFPRATIVIVELHSDYAYETCHPCPKCDPMLRAVGIGHVLHSTPHGKLAELNFTQQLLNSNNSASLLSNENVYIPLSAACRELEICCKRLPTSRV